MSVAHFLSVICQATFLAKASAGLEELVRKDATAFPLTSTKLWVQVKTCCKNQN